MIAPKAPMDQRLRLSPEFLVVVPDQAESAFKVRTDMLNEMVGKMCMEDSRVDTLFSLLASYNEEEVLSADTIFLICYELVENKYKKANC